MPDEASTAELTQKDKIQILLSEYAGLRSEITSRTGFAHQLTAIAAGVLFGLTQLSPTKASFWIGLTLAGTVVGMLWHVNARDIFRAARRMRELEHEINSRAGEHLLVWETLWGPAKTSWLARYPSRLEPLPRSELLALDHSFSGPKPLTLTPTVDKSQSITYDSRTNAMSSPDTGPSGIEQEKITQAAERVGA